MTTGQPLPAAPGAFGTAWAAGSERRARVARSLPVLSAIAIAACTVPTAPEQTTGTTADTQEIIRAFSVATVIEDGWRHLPLRGRTEYRIISLGDRLAVRAVGRQSASGLIRRILIDPNRCPVFDWLWRVDALQSSADLSSKDGDDVAASYFLMFGDPGMVSHPDPVPTLRYVWTNGRHAAGEVVDNPYMPGIVRSIVVRGGRKELAGWVRERRNIRDDFVKAFGKPPTSSLQAIAMFTDNDQTRQPVIAYYGESLFRCRAGEASSGRKHDPVKDPWVGATEQDFGSSDDLRRFRPIQHEEH